MSTSTRRYVQLAVGLVLFGVSISFFVQSHLGLPPWDVFHQGISDRTGIPMGTVGIIVGAFVLLLWIPLRQRPGIGTVCNVIVVGVVVDLTLPVLPEPGVMAVRIAFLLTAILMNALATALYIGAGLGPGPRDGLMTGFARRGHSLRVVRTAIELAVLAIGWMLGGDVGVGTALFAISIGPLVHSMLPRLTVREPSEVIA